MRRRTHIIICITLHALFVLVHVILCCLALLLEFPPAFPFTPTVFAPTVTVLAQGFTIIYCAVMVTTTQRLALQDMFHRRQTLSAIHDKSSAWLGLGSSTSALLRQKSLATDLRGVIATLLYLLCICIIHTSFPSVFTVQHATLLVASSAQSLGTQVSTVLAVQDLSNIPQISPDVYNFLIGYNQQDYPPIGLQSNTIYDTAPSNQLKGIPTDTSSSYATGTFPYGALPWNMSQEIPLNSACLTVNITSINVDCMYISGATLEATNVTSDSTSMPSTSESIGTSYTLKLHTDTIGSTALLPMAPQTLQLSPHPELHNTVLVASTYPVIDSQGSFSPSLNVEPPWGISTILPNATNLNSEGIQVQLMACEIQTLTSIALSILPSQELGSLSLAECNNNGTLWRKWNDSGRQTETTDPIIASIRKLVSVCPPSPNSSQSKLPDLELGTSTIISPAYIPSVLEDFLWSDIIHTREEVMPSYPFINNTQITLSELNSSLQRAFAALVWSLNNHTVDVERKQYGMSSVVMPITSSKDQSSIHLNLVMIGISFSASAGALIICILILQRSQGLKPEGIVPFVDTTGVLPVIWLLGHEPRLADIEEPETNVLRKAGMFEIGSDMFHRIDSRMNHRTRKAKGYEAVDPNDLGDEL